MSLSSGSVFSRLSKRSAIRDSSPLAVHLGNDNTMRRLLRDGVGINDVQKKYLSLCYSSRPSVGPNKDVALGLASGELVWNLTDCEREETTVIASLLSTKEAHKELQSVTISAIQAICPTSARQRAGAAKHQASNAKRSMLLARGSSRELALQKDPEGQVELFVALCKALPLMDALRALELDGLRNAFGKDKGGIQSRSGTVSLARGLKENSKLKSLTVRRVHLADRPRALGALSSALSGHPSLVALSLENCGLEGDSGGRFASAVIRAHAGRREGMVWSAGLRRPYGVVGNTAAAAPAKIATAGCLAVDLSGNRLGDTGVHALARALQSDTWLVGLNLSHNGVTDRGASLLSVCLHYNLTLCALVLDGNPDIGREAERRIADELETRSVIPEAVLEDPEVVLTLASWGFCAHSDIEEDFTSPPPPPQVEAIGGSAAVSDISDEAFGGDGGCGGGGGNEIFGGRAGDSGPGSAAAATSVLLGPSKTPTERKESRVREFHRWAGYIPSSTALDYTDGTEGARESRARTRPATPTTAPALGKATAVENGSDGEEGREKQDPGSRGRARSLSSRSSEVRSSGDGGRVSKRSKSSGPSGRLSNREGGQGVRTTRAAATHKIPWGAGPRVGGARARAQAWASMHLRASGSKAGGGGWTAGGHDRKVGAIPLSFDAGGRSTSARSSRGGRVRKGRRVAAGCACGGHNSLGTGHTKSAGSKVKATTRKKTRRGDAEMNPRRARTDTGGGRCGGIGFAVTAEQRRRRREAPALNVTREVLRGEDCYPKLAPRRSKGRGAPTGAAAVVADSNHALRPGRTDRVVDLLATLEKAVIKVCEDMWKLEDRVEINERRREATNALDNDSERNNRDAGVDDDVDDSHAEDREEVAAQVEACLREMWREAPPRTSADTAAGGATTSSSTSSSDRGIHCDSVIIAIASPVNNNRRSPPRPPDGEEERQEGFREHGAALLEQVGNGGGNESGTRSGTDDQNADNVCCSSGELEWEEDGHDGRRRQGDGYDSREGRGGEQSARKRRNFDVGMEKEETMVLAAPNEEEIEEGRSVGEVMIEAEGARSTARRGGEEWEQGAVFEEADVKGRGAAEEGLSEEEGSGGREGGGYAEGGGSGGGTSFEVVVQEASSPVSDEKYVEDVDAGFDSEEESEDDAESDDCGEDERGGGVVDGGGKEIDGRQPLGAGEQDWLQQENRELIEDYDSDVDGDGDEDDDYYDDDDYEEYGGADEGGGGEEGMLSPMLP